MAAKFSAGVVPFTDRKVNPGKIVKRVVKAGRLTLITSRGRGVAVVQSLADFAAAGEERALKQESGLGRSNMSD